MVVSQHPAFGFQAFGRLGLGGIEIPGGPQCTGKIMQGDGIVRAVDDFVAPVNFNSLRQELDRLQIVALT